MTKRNSSDTWNIIKKDTLFLEAVCCYLESEGILTESQREIFKRLWFCKACQEEEKNEKIENKKEERYGI